MPLDHTKLFPPKGSHPNRILYYRDRLINPYTVFRNQNLARLTMSAWYALGKQWAELDTSMAFDGVRGTIMRDVLDGMPHPVTNEIDPALEQEVINLVKRSWTPESIPLSDDPALKAAAQVATDRIQYRLKQLKWEEKRHQFGLTFAMMGLGTIHTTWRRDYGNMKIVGAPAAVWCENCETKLYSSMVPLATAKAGFLLDDGSHVPTAGLDSAVPMPLTDSFDPDRGHEEMIDLKQCPVCRDARNLVPYDVDPDEAEFGNDIYGRAMGLYDATGSSTLEIDIPHEIYPDNAGYRVAPDSLMRVGRRKIRSMDWIAAIAPDIVDELSPDSVTELTYNDPMLGEWDGISSYHAGYDRGMLDFHKNVDELIELPNYYNPMGRYVICVKDRVIHDDDLLVGAVDEDSGGQIFVPCAQLSFARFKVRGPDFWPGALGDNAISGSNQINGLDAQMVDNRLRWGSPNLLMTPEMWIPQGVQMDPGYGGGKFFFYQRDPMDPTAKPEVFGAVPVHESFMMERDRKQQDVRRALMPVTAQMAENSKISTTSGMQLKIEEEDKARSLREDSFTGCARESMTHLMRMEWVLHVDEDTRRALSPNTKHWSYKQYKGSMLRGQVEIEIKKGAFISNSVRQREAAREALADKVIDLSDPITRAELQKIYGVGENLGGDTNRQIEHAQRVWVDFRDHGIVRVMDEIDNKFIHFQILGTHLRTEEAEALADLAGWDDVQSIIAGWDIEIAKMVELEQAAIQFYGARLTGPQAQMAYAQAMIAYDQQLAVFDQQQQLYQKQLQTMPAPAPGPGGKPVAPQPGAPVAPVPPMKPPMPTDFPPLLQDKIMMLWSSKLQAAGWRPPQPTPEQMDEWKYDKKKDPIIYIPFRALVAAYRWELKPLTEMMGGQAPAPSMPSASGGTLSAGGSQPPGLPATGQTSTGGAN